VLACAICFGSSQAQAGTGMPFYAVDFGFYNYLESGGPYENADGGFAFGPMVGVYMISDWLAVLLDASVTAGILGEDYDQWFLTLPNIGAKIGTGWGPFALYVGGTIQLLGLDGIDDNLAFSLGNPFAVGGVQLGWKGFILRGEYQIGHTFRFGDHADYSFTNIAITIGYGPYYDFL